MPKVSIIIPTYNRANYLLEALDSIFQQTFKDYEIIIIDDGSTDDTQKTLRKAIEAGKVHYVFQENQGESAARNHGIRLAGGEYIAFLDSDDLFTPSKLEKQVAFLDSHPKIAFVHSWFSKFDDAGNHLGTRDTSRFSGNVYPEILIEWSVLMAVPCVMVRAEVLADIGEFDIKLRWGPDLDMWRRITQKYQIGVIPEVLSKVRVHPGGVSVDKAAAVPSFERYLQKAFDDDLGLTKIFKRKAYAKFYSNVGHNILAGMLLEQMPLVRMYSFQSIRNWPFQWSAYLGWLGSFLSPAIKSWLLGHWRQLNYRQ